MSVASHISETSELIAIKFDTVIASVMGMHHVLIVLTLSFIQGHTGPTDKGAIDWAISQQ